MINPRKGFLSLIGAVVLLFAGIYLSYKIYAHLAGPEGVRNLEQAWESFRDLLVGNGLWLFTSIAVLPGLILPVAPLLTLAGLWGQEHGPWISSLYCTVALSLNLSWTYWIARGPARVLIQKFLKRFKYELPTKPPTNLMQWALIVRLTPGVPFIFSNYGLGLVRMPFLPYLLISVPVLGVTGCGYVLVFAGIFGGQWKYLWTGLCLIAVMFLVGRILVKNKSHAS